MLALVPLLLLAVDAAGSWRAGFGWGFVAAAVCFVPMIAWLRPFGFLPWLLLAALQAVFMGLAVAVAAWWGRRRWWPAVFVVAWVAAEAARSRWPLGGFGWGALGYTQHDGGPLLAVARTLGVSGVSLACAAVSGAVAAALVSRRVRAPALTVVGVAVAVGLLGLVPPPVPTGETLDIASVQGNDLQSSGAAGVNRLESERVVDIATAMVQATAPLADDPPAVTIWPENSIDADPSDPANTAIRARVGDALALLDGGALVAGTLLEGPRPRTVYNAMAELLAGPEVGQAYRKRQPVPFAEYVPWRPLLGGFPPLRQVPVDKIGAPPSGPVEVAGTAIGFVICFENVFARLMRDQVRAGAELLVVSTNNASFGRTPMSRQHLAFSQVRAVESGRWTLHAGISGISGVVSPAGEVSQRTSLYEQAIVRGSLPLVSGATPYVVLGDVVGWAAMLLVVLLISVRRWWPDDRRAHGCAPGRRRHGRWPGRPAAARRHRGSADVGRAGSAAGG